MHLVGASLDSGLQSVIPDVMGEKTKHSQEGGYLPNETRRFGNAQPCSVPSEKLY